MGDRRIDGFFYGLFMDSEVIRESQVAPANPRRAFLDGYALHIGRRATLISTPGARAYGMVFALDQGDFNRLYDGPGLDQYQPETVLVHLIGGGELPAVCYILREVPQPDEANVEYTARLRAVLGNLDFPPEYIASIT